MEEYTELVGLKQQYPHLVVVLGTFDGVHRGHQSIIRRGVELARSIDGHCLVFTFQNHPLSVIQGRKEPPRIGTPALGRRLFTRLGVDILVSIPFTKSFASVTPSGFMQMLQRYFAPDYVVTGPNYTFGRYGKGTCRTLVEEGKRYGFTAVTAPPVLQDGKLVSSTRIRSLLHRGMLQQANTCLGYPFTVMGEVIHGQKRGRQLGFPTANLAIADTMAMLPNGVYATLVQVDGSVYGGSANIGDNPTFDNCDRRIEVHIQGFSGDIYGREILVSFLRKIRDEQRFASLDALVAQIRRDEEAVGKITISHLQAPGSMI